MNSANKLHDVNNCKALQLMKDKIVNSYRVQGGAEAMTSVEYMDDMAAMGDAEDMHGKEDEVDTTDLQLVILFELVLLR